CRLQNIEIWVVPFGVIRAVQRMKTSESALVVVLHEVRPSRLKRGLGVTRRILRNLLIVEKRHVVEAEFVPCTSKREVAQLQNFRLCVVLSLGSFNRILEVVKRTRDVVHGRI